MNRKKKNTIYSFISFSLLSVFVTVVHTIVFAALLVFSFIFI